MQKHAVYAQQVGLFVYQLVDKNGIICDVNGEHVVYPIQFVGHAEEQLEFPIWKERRNDNERD